MDVGAGPAVITTSNREERARGASHKMAAEYRTWLRLRGANDSRAGKKKMLNTFVRWPRVFGTLSVRQPNQRQFNCSDFGASSQQSV